MFKRGDGANHASANEDHRPEMSAFSEDSVARQGSDFHCEGDMPGMTHNSVVMATVTDHWLV